MSIENQAKQYFNSGYNCAESVLLAVCRESGYTESEIIKFIPRMATGFGGGIARNGSLCGALSGGLMALGLALGRDDAKESRDPCYPAADQFYNDFVDRFGHSSCRELTGLDMKNEQDRKKYQETVHLERCNPIVAWSALRVMEIIGEYSKVKPGVA
ncbi:C_GCAxxG_C_C family protein [candidate division TA06 bacterium]|uniref:C_GCAxxG_C_C family protein n=1 Tax=candidate division TA06 bacterium TaxID=2250710 RepID=A0A933MKW0_UNCT6|nr:C_GCAxxG_C_C family protein [candidate division TA06 bacterium]